MSKTSSLLATLPLATIALGFAAPDARPAIAQHADVLAVIVAPATSETEISMALVKRVFGGDPTEFAGMRLIPFNYAPDNSLRQTFDRAVLGFSSAQMGAYWVDRRIRGQGMPPRTVPTSRIMKAVVLKLPGAIGYIPAADVDASVRALNVDGLDFKAGSYPIK